MAEIDTISCDLGKVTLSKKQISEYPGPQGVKLYAKTGVCEGCQRKWIEKYPDARQNASLGIVVQGDKVTSCGNVLTD